MGKGFKKTKKRHNQRSGSFKNLEEISNVGNTSGSGKRESSMGENECEWSEVPHGKFLVQLPLDAPLDGEDVAEKGVQTQTNWLHYSYSSSYSLVIHRNELHGCNEIGYSDEFSGN